MTLLQRAAASVLLIAGMLALPSAAYPLLYGRYAVAAVVGVTAISALVAFRRFTETLTYSRTAATVAALVALVCTVEALGRTKIGKTGATRTVYEQAALLLLTGFAASLAAFAGSFVRLRLPLFGFQGPDRPKDHT